MEYFEKVGVNAWRPGAVPHYMTCNPVIGEAYASLIFAVLKDRARMGFLEEKVYILELGAGSGRLAAQILHHLTDLISLSPVETPPFCYVLSDFSRISLDFWGKHPCFQEYFQNGLLDYGLFNATEDGEIHLERCGKTLTPGCLNQPLVAVANYLLDTIPQELFRITQGRLERISLEILVKPRTSSKNMAHFLENATLNFHGSSTSPSLFEEATFNTLLEEYQAELQDTYLLFPHVGLRCLLRLKRLSQSGLIWIGGDKGGFHMEDLDHCGPPSLVLHGSFSLSVNFHAFKRLTQLLDGVPMFPIRPRSGLMTCCLLLTHQPKTYGETLMTFERGMKHYGPEDFFVLKRFLETRTADLSFKEILAAIRLSGYDAQLFQRLFPRMYELLEDLEESEIMALLQMARHLLARFFPLPEDDDLPLVLGNLFMTLRLPRHAMAYYEQSLRLFGRTTHALNNLALCHQALGDLARAEKFYKELLELDPSDSKAKEELAGLYSNNG